VATATSHQAAAKGGSFPWNRRRPSDVFHAGRPDGRSEVDRPNGGKNLSLRKFFPASGTLKNKKPG